MPPRTETAEAFAQRLRACLRETLERVRARGAKIEDSYPLRPWTTRDVRRFELRAGVSLPWNFRDYLQSVGSGGFSWEFGEREGGWMIHDVDDLAAGAAFLSQLGWTAVVPVLGYGSRYCHVIHAETGRVMEIDAYQPFTAQKILAPDVRAWFDRRAASDFEHFD